MEGLPEFRTISLKINLTMIYRALLQMQLELIGCERKVSLMEVIAKATGALQDLTRYPYKSYITKELTYAYNINLGQ